MAETKQQGIEANTKVIQSISHPTSPPKKTEPGKELAKRPDKGGHIGRQIDLFANFFPLRVGIETVHQYNVTIGRDENVMAEDDVPLEGQLLLPIKLCRAIVNECAKQHNWPSRWVFDGKKNIYCPEDVFGRQIRNFQVNMGGDPQQPKIFEVRINWVASISMHEIGRYHDRGDIALPKSAIQSLEVCLRFSATNNPQCQITGRSIYFNNPHTNVQIPGGIDLWLGYHQGVKLCQQGLAMNVETTCTAFTRSRKVIEVMCDAVGKDPRQCKHMDAGMRIAMKRAVMGLMVKTTHRQNSGKKFKCRGITNDPATDAMFVLRDGTEMSVGQYWGQKYGPLQFPWMPCLDVSKGGKVMYLPPEVCEVVSGQRIQKMTENITREMIRQTAKPPEQRKKMIEEALESANIAHDKSAQAFKLQVDRRMATVKGRILPQPHLEYTRPECMDTGDRGAWNLDNVKFKAPGKIRSWAILSFIDKRLAFDKQNGLLPFINGLRDMLRSVGVQIPEGTPSLVHRERMPIEEALQQAVQEAGRQYRQHPDIILVVLERKESYPYQEVKCIAERDLGVTTQCFVAGKAGIGAPIRGREQYLANLSMKINHKVGGVNTGVATEISRVLWGGRNRPTIVLGASVIHPTGFDSTEPSVGAVVGSMDPFMGQFSTRVQRMGHREDKMSMQAAVKDLLTEWRQRNNGWPESILVYRTGVSEGQFSDILEHEYNEIANACKDINPSYKPSITIVAVQKMHHTRLFPTSRESADHKGNIKPGTCVDTGITSCHEFDFYLNSHAGIQGTNKAAHYYVLVDENGFGSDTLQLFSYWMCFLYCRCTRSVSFATPAYYAYLAAQHGRYHVNFQDAGDEGPDKNSMFHANLNQKMFFV